jgi:hypothetical protein
MVKADYDKLTEQELSRYVAIIEEYRATLAPLALKVDNGVLNDINRTLHIIEEIVSFYFLLYYVFSLCIVSSARSSLQEN